MNRLTSFALLCLMVSSAWARSKSSYKELKPNKWMQKFLVDQHNEYRRMVPATNMKKMIWDKNLARTAQQHANRCTLEHSKPYQRNHAGENIWANSWLNKTSIIWYWFKQGNDPTCNCNDLYKPCCGHYTQVVWAMSYRLGCGITQCNKVSDLAAYYKYVVVCHYGPPGNWLKEKYVNGRYTTVPTRAFKPRKYGKNACSQCGFAFKQCDNGLCTRSFIRY